MSRLDVSETVVVRATGLQVRFPRFTLGPLSFEVRTGDVVALVGLNASGKTTLLRTLAGRRDRYTGSVVVAGLEAARHTPAVRARVGFLPDRVAALASLRVSDYHAFLSRFHPEWDEAYAGALRGRLGIDAHATMGTLSRGTLVKVGLIAAEAFRPPLLVLDEPTSGLDLVARQAFLDVITDAMAAARDRAIIFSTHVVDDAHRVATRVFALAEGSLRPEMQPSDIEAFVDGGIHAHASEHGDGRAD